ncbi:hypothetical protein CTA2_5664 [Colletotrichum tanaceti]|nr:hypothetical protein CTA2_5664 [Colletotrichum tanaceti]
MPPKWRVGSYFINVGLGDGAIHLLLDDSKTAKKDRVVSAVLIDGGLRGDKQVASTTEKIMAEYGFTGAQQVHFWFRAVVVTHWDRDHYEAVMNMFQADFAANKYARCRWIRPETVFYLPSTHINAHVLFGPPKVYALNNAKDKLTMDGHDLCRAVFGHKCIGVDLFSGEMVGKGTNATIPVKLSKILRDCPKTDLLTRPLLLCVGIDFKLMSGETLPKGTSTMTNGSSMMCLLVQWDGTSIDAQLYTGGDAEDHAEEVLEAWLEDSGVTKLNVIKCGHHGSSNATHSKLFNLKPEYFIMSVGEDHGHPSLALIFFIIAYFSHRESYGSNRRILSTRYPYWLLYNSLPDLVVETKHLNIEKVLSQDLTYYHEEMTRLNPRKKKKGGKGKDEDKPIVESFFPDSGSGLEEVINMVDDEEQKKYNYWFDKIHTYKNITLDQMRAQDRALWKKLEKLDKKKWDAWSNLQNEVIDRMRMYWHGFGHPTLPVCNHGPHRTQEVSWIYIKFFDTKPPGPQGSEPEFKYESNANVRITLKFMESAALSSKQKKEAEARRRDIVDQLVAMQKDTVSNLGKRACRDVLREFEETKQKKQKRPKKAGGVSYLVAQKNEMSVLESTAVAVEVDKVDVLSWEFLTDGVTLSAIPLESPKRFEIVDGTVGGLLWLRESLQATAAEISLRQGGGGGGQHTDTHTTTTPRDIDRFVVHTPHLTLSSSPDALKSQFGDSIADEINFRGYHFDLEAILLGLDLEAMIPLTLSDFCHAVAFGLGGVAGWIVALLADVPVEIRPPKPATDDGDDPYALSRCGAWVQPQLDRTILRLEGVIPVQSESVKPLADFIKKHLHASDVFDIRVVGSATSTLARGSSEVAEYMELPDKTMIRQESRLSFAGALQWTKADSRVGFALTISESDVTLFLQPPAGLTVKDVADWIVDRFASSMEDHDRHSATNMQDDYTKVLGDLAKAIIPRQLSLTIGEGPTLTGFQIDVELQLHLGAEGEHVPIHGRLKWTPGRLELLGEIWDLEDQSVVPFNVHPFRESFSEVRPLQRPGETAVDSIWLPRLFSKDATEEGFPKGIPLTLSNASVRVTLGDWKDVTITGKLQCSAPSTGHEVMPSIWLDELQLLYTRNITGGSDVLELRGNINLKAPDYVMSLETSAVVRAYIAYDQGGGWTLSAQAVELQLANLYPLLPADGSNHALMHIMSSVWVPEFTVSVKFAAKQASAVSIDGTLVIGPLQMNLTYRHDAKGWLLTGEFKSATPDREDATLEELLGVFAREHMDSLPEFVRNFKIPLSNISASLTCSSEEISCAAAGSTEPKSKCVVFSFAVTVEKFSFVFVQIQDHDGSFPKQEETRKTKPRRILRFSLEGLPGARDIPLVQELPQPFDEMVFLWASADITVAEGNLLKKQVFTGQTPPLHWKEVAKKNGPGDDSTTVALAEGCHFQLILREQDSPSCALDYVFNGSTKQGVPPVPVPPAHPGGKPPATPATPAASSKAEPVPAPSGGGGATTTPVTRSSKGLTIRHMGLNMKDKKTLTITIDAVASLGPVALTLIGFEVDIDFENFKTPSDMAKLGIGFSLYGMAVAFSRPPALLAGLFSREVHGKVTTYAGGLAVGVGAWQFLAAGVYEEHDDFKTVFVFAKLNGPLISFGFAEVNGIVGGFGYNSVLRMPGVGEVTKFPFVSLNGGGQDPAGNVLEQFAALTDTNGGGGGGDDAWFKSQKDSLWLAAGLGVKAFQLLEVQAVVCIDLSPNPQVGIFAEAIASLPKGSSPETSFLFLDIGIAAMFDPGTGILSLRGQLTPQSFILSRSCKLNGGFALVYFLPASGHDGDWVFSAGGYHPAFRVPSHYPQDLKRLGISWSLDSEISITGEAYFAITPQAVMGGGRLDLVYQSGHTRASFSAYADFLIYYEPFQFRARVGVNVSASTRIGWGLLSKDVSAEISADLDLHGPPVAGTAHLHFWFFTISVRFGPDQIERAGLDWDRFYTLVKQCTDPDDARNLPEHLVSLLQGRCSSDSKQEIAAPPKKGEKPPPPSPWLVRAAAFEFEVVARFPLREVRYNGKAADEAVHARVKDVYAMPMKFANRFENSDMTITIRDDKQGIDADFTLEPILKRVPGALWNRYDPNKTLLESDSMIEHVMGVRLKPVKSRNSPEALPPINMTKFNSLPVGGHGSKFPPAEYSSVMAAVPVQQEDKLAPDWRMNQQSVCDMWRELRHKTTGGGSLYETPQAV